MWGAGTMIKRNLTNPLFRKFQGKCPEVNLTKKSESQPEPLKGYRGQAREVLESFGARVWGEVDVETTRGKFHGIVLPRSELADDQHIVLKLATGYNVGVAAANILNLREVGTDPFGGC